MKSTSSHSTLAWVGIGRASTTVRIALEASNLEKMSASQFSRTWPLPTPRISKGFPLSGTTAQRSGSRRKVRSFKDEFEDRRSEDHCSQWGRCCFGSEIDHESIHITMSHVAGS